MGSGNQGAGLASDLTARVICDTEVFGPCADAPGMHDARQTTVTLLALSPQRPMHDVCDGVPGGSFCRHDRER